MRLADRFNTPDFTAELVDYDTETDIALLSVCCSPWFLAAEEAEGVPKRGDEVHAISLGEYGHDVSHGEILGADALGHSIGSTTDVQPGFSGGALVRAGTYRLLGIITAKVDSDSLREWPDREDRRFLEELGWWFPPGTAMSVWLETAMEAVGTTIPTVEPTPTPTLIPRVIHKTVSGVGTQWPDSMVTLPPGDYEIVMRNLNRIKLGECAEPCEFHPPVDRLRVHPNTRTVRLYVEAEDHNRWTIEFWRVG